MKTRIPAAFALAALCLSCASVPHASAEDDARAKTFETRPDRCGLYVFRDGSGGIELPLDLDGLELGSTGPQTYLITWLHPGKHTLSSHTDENVRVQLVAQPGTLMYVHQECELGYWHFESKLKLVGEAEGQKGVRSCALAEMAP